MARAARRRARRLPGPWLSRCCDPGSCILSGWGPGIGVPAEFGAVDLVKEREHPLGSGVANAIEYRLRLLAGSDESLLPQFREVLRERGLAEVHPLHQLAHRELACLGEVAEDQQPAFVRQQL